MALSQNLYAYVQNSPLNFYDPSGRVSMAVNDGGSGYGGSDDERIENYRKQLLELAIERDRALQTVSGGMSNVASWDLISGYQKRIDAIQYQIDTLSARKLCTDDEPKKLDYDPFTLDFISHYFMTLGKTFANNTEASIFVGIGYGKEGYIGDVVSYSGQLVFIKQELFHWSGKNGITSEESEWLIAEAQGKLPIPVLDKEFGFGAHLGYIVPGEWSTATSIWEVPGSHWDTDFDFSLEDFSYLSDGKLSFGIENYKGIGGGFELNLDVDNFDKEMREEIGVYTVIEMLKKWDEGLRK